MIQLISIILLILIGFFVVVFVIAFHWYLLTYYSKETNRPLNGKPFKYNDDDIHAGKMELKVEEPALDVNPSQA